MSLEGTLDTSSLPVQSTTNYLVPSSGATHGVQVDGTFGDIPAVVDWRTFASDDFPFQPQGVFIDNTQGTGELTLSILTSAGGSSVWNVICPAGAQMQAQFPAPNGQLSSITGDGYANLIFVDFPVLPAAGAVSIIGTPTVDIGGQPISTEPSVNAAGTPYQTTEVPALATPVYGSASGSTTTINIATPAGQNLRAFALSMSGDASLAAAGRTTVTVTCNAVKVFEQSVYLPDAAADVGGAAWQVFIDLSKIGIATGLGGTAATTVVLGTALATGILEANCYFA